MSDDERQRMLEIIEGLDEAGINVQSFPQLNQCLIFRFPKFASNRIGDVVLTLPSDYSYSGADYLEFLEKLAEEYDVCQDLKPRHIGQHPIEKP